MAESGTAMTERRTAAAVLAGRWLIDRQLAGVVWLDRDGVVVDREGGLVDWVEAGRALIDQIPALGHHQDSIDALCRGRGGTLSLTVTGRPRGGDAVARSYFMDGFRLPGEPCAALVLRPAETVDSGHGFCGAEASQPGADPVTEANRARTVFLANISHQLRTPLNVIIGNAEILRDWDPSHLPSEDLHVFAEDILENGTYLLDHINDLIDLATAEVGPADLVEEPVDLEALIDRAVTQAHAQFEAGARTIRHPATPGLPCLLGDGRRLRHVLLELIGRTMQVSPDDGAVAVRGFVADDGGLAIEIEGTGDPITEDPAQRGARPIGFADAPDRRYLAPSEGLGLPLAESLIEQHGGRVTMEGTHGTAIRITVQFPPHRTCTGA